MEMDALSTPRRRPPPSPMRRHRPSPSSISLSPTAIPFSPSSAALPDGASESAALPRSARQGGTVSSRPPPREAPGSAFARPTAAGTQVLGVPAQDSAFVTLARRERRRVLPPPTRACPPTLAALPREDSDDDAMERNPTREEPQVCFFRRASSLMDLVLLFKPARALHGRAPGHLDIVQPDHDDPIAHAIFHGRRGISTHAAVPSTTTTRPCGRWPTPLFCARTELGRDNSALDDDAMEEMNRTTCLQ